MDLNLSENLRLCGRMTRYERPCRQWTHPFTPACRQHCSDEELTLGQFIYEVCLRARAAGADEARHQQAELVRRLKADNATLKQELSRVR
jgi:hypothetical protein